MSISVKSLFLIFFLFIFSAYFYLEYEKQEKIKQHLQLKTKQYLKSYNVLYSKNKALATVVFKTKIDTNRIKSIFSQALYADKQKRQKTRKELFNSLKNTYKILKEYKVRQLHFHLPNNESFLRFHKPEKFGDNLSQVRETVKYVNRYKKPIDGFEEGKIYNGFRFVYPLFYQNNYIGSVEISFSALSLNIEMMQNYDVIGKFLIAKEVVDSKVFQSEKNNYILSKFTDFYYEKPIKKELQKYNKNHMSFKISQTTKNILHKRRYDPSSFSLYDESSDTIITFLKIKNPITRKVVALFVLRSDASYIKIQQEICNKAFLSTVLVSLLVALLLYKILNEKDKLSEEINKKTKQLQKSKKEMEDYIKIIDKHIIASSTDIHGKLTYVSKAFCDISGYSQKELLGKNHTLINDLNGSDLKYRQIWTILKKNQIWKGELQNKRKNGEVYWVDVMISPLFKQNKKVGYTVVSQDITDKKLIEKISQTDQLTKVFNRLKLDEVLFEEITRNDRYNLDFSIILLDIDNFKSINDTFGHLIGDKVLIEIANILTKNIRKTDILGRWGGEEFLIICTNTDIKGVQKIAESLRQTIEKTDFQGVGNITASFGATQFYRHEQEEDMLKRADEALYLSKNNGRNQVNIVLKD